MSAPILLTRPPGQIKATARALRDHGLEVIEMPLTGIGPPRRRPTRKQLEFARMADCLIFTSRNAVQWAQADLPVDPAQTVTTIGLATAAQARRAGWNPAWTPAGQSSENLLEAGDMPRLHGRVCLVGGSGGRRLLGKQLAQRGLEVEKLCVYRREALDPGLAAFDAAVRRRPRLVFSSGHALRQWEKLSRQYQRPEAMNLSLLVASQRLCKLARQLDFQQPATALPTLSDAALIAALTEQTE